MLMPSRPRTSSVTNDTLAGPLVISFFTAEPSRTVSFSVVHNSFPTNVDTSYKKALFEGGLKQGLGADGRLISDTEIAFHGYPGREWKFEKLKGQALVTMRAYLVGHEFYQAICVMPKTRVCQKHVQEFLESFELKHE